MKVKRLSWGNPKESDYDLILDYYSETKINSSKTSSVPLAQYWKNTNEVLVAIANHLNIDDYDAEIYFEFPTRSYKRNKSSMSDVMIITKNNRIAIEAKYTEYDKGKYETIADWLKRGNKDNKNKVLDHWNNIIGPFAKIETEYLEDLPYQFFHRTASACFESPGNSTVIFQLFWDAEEKQKLEEFMHILRNAVIIVNPNPRLQYFLHLIEIEKFIETDMESVFQTMKNADVYQFGKEEFNKIDSA